jgi:hypothetical protein
MVFRVTYTICEGPKLDVKRSQIVAYANRQYEVICQYKCDF